MLIGSRIKKYREDSNLPLSYVAEHLNIKNDVLEKIENNVLGEKGDYTLGISGAEIKSLSELFAISEYELLFGENTENIMFYSKTVKKDREEIISLVDFSHKL